MPQAQCVIYFIPIHFILSLNHTGKVDNGKHPDPDNIKKVPEETELH
jgi:hypothetical protein